MGREAALVPVLSVNRGPTIMLEVRYVLHVRQTVNHATKRVLVLSVKLRQFLMGREVAFRAPKGTFSTQSKKDATHAVSTVNSAKI